MSNQQLESIIKEMEELESQMFLDKRCEVFDFIKKKEVVAFLKSKIDE